MDWESLSYIATSISAIIGAVSLSAGFVLYRISKRDSNAANLRATIAGARASSERLDMLVNYELTNELAASVVYSRDLDLLFQELYSDFFASDSSSNDEPSDSQERRKEKLQSYLDNEFPAITSPIHTPIIEAYESTLIKIDSDIAQYQTDYPGLFRVISSMSRLFLNILVNNKRLVHREEAWKRIIIEILFPIRSKIDSSDKLRNRLFLTLIQLVLLSIRDDQKDINDLRKITDIVADAYLRKESSELASLSRKEAKQPLIPITSTKRISEDLREAEKALRLVLDEDELLNFREFVAIFEDRNREQQNEPSGSQ